MTESEHDDDWDGLRRAVAARLAVTGRGHLTGFADEFVSTLAEARRLRAIARQNPTTELTSGRVLLHPGFEGADRAIRRATNLAKALGLTASPAAADNKDPFAELDAWKAGPFRISNATTRSDARTLCPTVKKAAGVFPRGGNPNDCAVTSAKPS